MGDLAGRRWKFNQAFFPRPHFDEMKDRAGRGFHAVRFQQRLRNARIAPAFGAAVADKILVRDELGLKGSGHDQDVTIRANGSFVRADSSLRSVGRGKCSNRLECHSSFVRALGISKRGLDLLRLSSSLIDLRFVAM